jgi:hypothetical protein
VLLPGCGHTEWMFDDHPVFGQMIDRLDEFFTDELGAG